MFIYRSRCDDYIFTKVVWFCLHGTTLKNSTYSWLSSCATKGDWISSSAEWASHLVLTVVFGPLSRHGVCPGSANGSRLVLGCREEGRWGRGRHGETWARSLWPQGGGVATGGSAEQRGEVGAPVQVSGSPSSLTNFEIDLWPLFPRSAGKKAEKGLGL